MSDAAESPQRSTTWLAGLALLSAGGLAVYAWTRPPKPSPPTDDCTPATQLPWQEDPAWLQGWDRAAAGARGIVQRDLDAWTERWTAARVEACGREVPAPALHCLEQQAGRARALASELQRLEPGAQSMAYAAALALPSTEDCGTPPDAASPRDEDVSAVLARGRGLLDAGQPGAAAQLVETLDLGEDDPLRAQARWVRGHGQAPRDAHATWQRALADAIAIDDPALAYQIALALSVSSSPDEPLAASQRWWMLASAYARRLPTTALRQHGLLQAQAKMLAQHGQPDAALAMHEPALALLESSLGSTHPALVPGLRDSAVAAASVGKLDAAERLAARALELADDALGARHPESLATLDAIAAAMRQGGAPQKATAWLRIAIERRDETQRGPTLVSLGEAYLQAGSIGDAADTFARAVTWSLSHDGHALEIRIALGRAAVAQARGDADTAAEHLQETLAGELDASSRNAVRMRLVSILLDAERFDDARVAAAEALEATASDDAGDAARGEALSVAADVALRSGRPAEAIALSRRAVARLVGAHGPEDPSVLVALIYLGTACLDEKRDDEAAAAFSRAVQIARTAEPNVLVAAALGWATALWRTGAKEEATAVVRDVHAAVARDARPGAAADAAAWLAARGLSVEPKPEG